MNSDLFHGPGNWTVNLDLDNGHHVIWTWVMDL